MKTKVKTPACGSATDDGEGLAPHHQAVARQQQRLAPQGVAVQAHTSIGINAHPVITQGQAKTHHVVVDNLGKGREGHL